MVLTSFTVKIRSFDGTNATKEFNIGLIIEVLISYHLNISRQMKFEQTSAQF